ncbi:hypothetical protein [uncultured Lacinutrix sp.]|uniref:hypothetical protein n=1 Tax=uncultured Lacinutrix sp. TaxID=574032 RepID=UPI00261DE5EA|nr:hypothetical protein [uncultured Lacinutrix sp.]
MDEKDKIRSHKDKIRIFLILYYFSENHSDSDYPSRKKIFKSEVRIQKIDFLLRNPDYFAHELLNIAIKDNSKKAEIKLIIKNIFDKGEPIIRRLEMERFFFGAYEDIDDVIGFLKSIDFIDFSSKKSTDLKTIEKQYYITETAIQKMDNTISNLSSLQWYTSRCQLIKKYFGNLSGTQLKVSQYQIEEYRETSYKNYIGSIKNLVIDEFKKLYNEQL